MAARQVVTIVAVLTLSMISSLGPLSAPAARADSCGSWGDVYGGGDGRLGINVLADGSNAPGCAGQVEVANTTGYTFELTTSNTNVSPSGWRLGPLPYPFDFILPGIDLDVQVSPNDSSQTAQIGVTGEINAGSVAVDLAYQALKALIDAVPGASCALGNSDVITIVVNEYTELTTAASLYLQGPPSWLAAAATVSNVVPTVINSVVDELQSGQMVAGCASALAQAIVEDLGGPSGLVAAVAANVVQWAVNIVAALIQYQGQPAYAEVTYTPSAPTAAAELAGIRLNSLHSASMGGTTAYPAHTRNVYLHYSVVTPAGAERGQAITYRGGVTGTPVSRAALPLGVSAPITIALHPTVGSWPSAGYCTVIYLGGQRQQRTGYGPLAWTVGTAVTPDCRAERNPLRLWLRGSLQRGRSSSITVSVHDRLGTPIRGVLIRLSGDGVYQQARTTRAGTSTINRLLPRSAGTIRIYATHPGYHLATAAFYVRP